MITLGYIIFGGIGVWILTALVYGIVVLGRKPLTYELTLFDKIVILPWMIIHNLIVSDESDRWS